MGNKTYKKSKFFQVSTLALAMSVCGQQAMAQNDPNSDDVDLDDLLEEIVVTARLIEENIQDVPVSVSALNAADIRKRGIEGLTEIARTTPNFSFENFNGPIATPVIRGQSQSRLTNPIQNVATFYNGVYLQRNYMVDASLLNIGQVEVLRGPQVAAFGRNAFAGAISYRNKEIGDEPTAFVSVAAGENEYQRVDLTGELPVNSVLGFTAGYSTSEYDGAWDNNHALADISDPLTRTSGNVGGWENDIYHLGANVNIADTALIKINYINSEREIENNPQFTLGGSFLSDPASNTLNCGIADASLFCGTFPVNPVAVNGRKEGLVIDPRLGVELESEILTVEADIEFTDELTLSLTYGQTEGDFSGAGSSVYDQEVGYDGAFAGTLAGRLLVDTSGNGSIESDSFEARFTFDSGDGFAAYAGAFYSDTDDLTQFALISLPAQTEGPLDPGLVLNFPGFAANSLENREVTSVYGFVNYEVNDSLALSAELRYTEEDITETNRFNPAAITSNSESYDYLTPKLAVTYFISDASSLYVSYAEGLKAGGFNAGGSNPAGFADPSQATFDEETNKTYELGSRNIFLDGDLTLNATLFLIDSKDLQVNVPRVGDVVGNVVGNRAEAESLGIELSLDYSVTDNLGLNFGIGYVNAEYGSGVIDLTNAARCDDVVCSTAGDIGGNQIERAPSTTVNAGFDWETELLDSVDFFALGNVGYQNQYYSNAINTAEIESRTIVDLALGINTDSGFEVKLAIDNVFDEEYVSSAFEVNFLRSYILNVGDRRRSVLSVSYQY